MAREGKFPLGKIVATPGALDLLEEVGSSGLEYLVRHCTGDWGELDKEDVEANEQALKQGTRLLSNYPVKDKGRLWIITEWDRSVTTMLLPSEY